MVLVISPDHKSFFLSTKNTRTRSRAMKIRPQRTVIASFKRCAASTNRYGTMTLSPLSQPKPIGENHARGDL